MKKLNDVNSCLKNNQETSKRDYKLLKDDQLYKNKKILIAKDEYLLDIVFFKIIEKYFSLIDSFFSYFKAKLIIFLIFIIAFSLRLWNIDYPKNIVSNEYNYIQQINFYLKKNYYFRTQPPLAIQLITTLISFTGYDGKSSFQSFQKGYPDSFPLKTYRFLPCLFGSFLIPLNYFIAKELKLSNFFSIFVSLLLLFENSLLTQTRYILTDSFLYFFGTISLYFCILFRKTKLFSIKWFIYLFLSCFFLSCAISVKFIGITWLLLCLCLVSYDYWLTLPNNKISTSKLFGQAIIFSFTFFILPLSIYIGVFYIHLSILKKSGPDDALMTSAFQMSLEGGLSSISKDHPLEIAHGSEIILKHTYGEICWLGSCGLSYPKSYPNGRNSSYQLQVNCGSTLGKNNWWIVKKPEINNAYTSYPIDKIKHGDIIQLVYMMVPCTLNSHNFYAPVSLSGQEVSCYYNKNVSMSAQDLWQVELLNKEETNNVWHAITSNVRLKHVDSFQYLKVSGHRLPHVWGFNELEVIADNYGHKYNDIWTVEDHYYNEKENVKNNIKIKSYPTKKKKFTFWKKMKELQYKMLIEDNENSEENYIDADSLLDLILMNNGIRYWIHKTKSSQVFLLGNLFIHYFSLFSIIIYIFLLCFYLLRKKRKIHDIDSDEWEKFVNIGLTCVLGYILQLLSLIFTDSSLLYMDYIPAIIFKILVLSALLEHLKIYFKSYIDLLAIFIVFSSFYAFIKFFPLSYGIGLETVKEIENLRWKNSWGLDG